MKVQLPDYLDKPHPLRLLAKLRAKQFYWRSTLARAIRTFDDRNNHVAIPMKLNLPDDFVYDDNRAMPRGLVKEGRQYSSEYSLQFTEMPEAILEAIRLVVPIARLYFQDDVIIRRPHLWRNYHIPPSYRFQDVYSDNFHQDLVVDQFNLQLFILLDDVTVDHGPFIYLNPTDQSKYLDETKSRLDNLDYPGIPWVGKRGDAMLFSTGYTLHRASSPAEGIHRDIMSIAFFPAYASTEGEKIDALPRHNV